MEMEEERLSNLKLRHLTRFWTGCARSSFPMIQTVDLHLFSQRRMLRQDIRMHRPSKSTQLLFESMEIEAHEGCPISLRCIRLRQRIDLIMDCCYPLRVQRSKVDLLWRRPLELQNKNGRESLITVRECGVPIGLY